MKFLLVLVAVVGLGSAAPSASFTLHDDMMDFVNLLPLDEMREISIKYLNTDAEIQRIVKYLQSEEWHGLVHAVGDKPSWIEFKDYMTEAGIPMDEIIEFIHNVLENAHPEERAAFGLREYVDEMLAIIPHDQLIALLNDKLQTSADFQKFWAQITDEKAHALFNEVRAMEEVQRIAEVLREMGIDVQKIIDIIYSILGW